MNLTLRPIYQKTGKPKKDKAYLARVRELPCIRCGKHGPNEAHHCRDQPDFNEQGLYESLPGAAMKSSDRDAIPLCSECHWTFHNDRTRFHADCGKDYGHIATTRAALSYMEIDF